MKKSRPAAVAALALGLSATPSALAAPAEEPGLSLAEVTTADSAELRGAVRVGGIFEHLTNFQRIADANDGTRASGTPGYQASVDYVVGRLLDAGYAPTVQPFRFNAFELESSSVALDSEPVADDAYSVFSYSGAGEVTDAPVVGVDLAEPGTSTSGCEASDFEGLELPDGPWVALLQRGACTFATKAVNAEAAGAAAVIIYNEGDEGRTDLILGTLGDDSTVGIPVVGLDFETGSALAEASTASISVDAATVTRTSYNVLAETPEGRDDRTVVVGGHLDSVEEGPGINDNGSGTATILEVAEELAERDSWPRNTTRFAFWGAEESGLIGSTHYVANLDARDREDIVLNLNFDMVGSPNFVRFVYDGDGSADPGSAGGPQGSQAAERIFTEYFDSVGLASEPTAFDGRSDYGPFIEVGIPAGGLFSGAEGIKTEEQAAVYGGTAGVAYDACYHEACDTLGNVNALAVAQFSGAVAHAVEVWSSTPTPIKGVAPAERSTLGQRGPASRA